MNYTTNFNLRLPERNEQFNLDDWNNNTESIDFAMQTNKTNISNNATNITSILTGLSTVNTSDTNSVYYKLMKLIYPVGSLYWSSKSTNPATLFGGTWVQIKDRFVLACGDTYKTVGATGGASSVTLSVSNMPSHNHGFSWSGSHSHGVSDPGHSHGYELGEYDGAAGHAGERTGRYYGTANTYSATTGISINSKTISISGTTGSNGSGSAFNILPPYVVKYCWERTA